MKPDEQSDRQINKQTKQLIKTTYIKLSERDSLTPGANIVRVSKIRLYVPEFMSGNLEYLSGF